MELIGFAFIIWVFFEIYKWAHNEDMKIKDKK